MPKILHDPRSEGQRAPHPTRLHPVDKALTYHGLADALGMRVRGSGMAVVAHCVDCTTPLRDPKHAVRHANRLGHAVVLTHHSVEMIGHFEQILRVVEGQ